MQGQNPPLYYKPLSQCSCLNRGHQCHQYEAVSFDWLVVANVSDVVDNILSFVTTIQQPHPL